MDVSVIIVNWNSQEYLKKCIASILVHTQNLSCEIVVIDSGSFDGCDRMLRECYPHVRFIQTAENIGFARSNNKAFGESTGDVVLFLNPDTELVGPAINTMYAVLTSLPSCGIVGCKLLNSDGSTQSSCIQAIPTLLNQLLDSEFFRAKWPKSDLWGMQALYGEATVPREVEAISGACVMIRRSTFEAVGRFSEDYFMYAEDIDLSYKVREAGYKNYFVATDCVIHHGGSSSQQAASTFSVVMMREAIWRFLRKTRGDTYGFAYRASMGMSALGRLLLLGLVAAGHRRSEATTQACRKWLAIFRWSVNQDGLVKQYYPRYAPPSTAVDS